MNNLYRNKRVKAKISEYTMAKEMGLSLEDYRKIENSAVNLSKEWLDKFNDIIYNAKEINFNREQRLHDIKIAIKVNELKKKMIEQGYNQTTLAKKLGYHPSLVCDVMRLRKINDDRIEEVYDFLMKPTNKNIKKVVEETKVEEPVVKEEPIETPKVYKDIEVLEEENARLRLQLTRYEKLIDRL